MVQRGQYSFGARVIKAGTREREHACSTAAQSDAHTRRKDSRLNVDPLADLRTTKRLANGHFGIVKSCSFCSRAEAAYVPGMEVWMDGWAVSDCTGQKSVAAEQVDSWEESWQPGETEGRGLGRQLGKVGR